MDQRLSESTSQPPRPKDTNAVASQDIAGERLSIIQRTKNLLTSKFQKTKELITSNQTRKGANLETTEEETPDQKVAQKSKELLSASKEIAGTAKESLLSTVAKTADKMSEVHYLLSTQINRYAVQAFERIKGALPTKEELHKLTGAISQRLEKTKVFGQPLPDFLAGTLSGAAAKEAARWGLVASGLGGFPAAAAVGAAGGATSAGA